MLPRVLVLGEDDRRERGPKSLLARPAIASSRSLRKASSRCGCSRQLKCEKVWVASSCPGVARIRPISSGATWSSRRASRAGTIEIAVRAQCLVPVGGQDGRPVGVDFGEGVEEQKPYRGPCRRIPRSRTDPASPRRRAAPRADCPRRTPANGSPGRPNRARNPVRRRNCPVPPPIPHPRPRIANTPIQRAPGRRSSQVDAGAVADDRQPARRQRLRVAPDGQAVDVGEPQHRPRRPNPRRVVDERDVPATGRKVDDGEQ